MQSIEDWVALISIEDWVALISIQDWLLALKGLIPGWPWLMALP
jgi:hypothetical protein